MGHATSDASRLGVLRASLPAPLTSFIGRARELAEAGHRLSSSRLLTVTGTAGCGKTRLALRLAAEAGNTHADGVVWIGLAEYTDPTLAFRALARQVEAPVLPDQTLLDALIGTLRNKHLLLVLDNCEHLLEACRQLAGAVLSAPGISVLATSREPLGLPGEALYPLPPMALPPPNCAGAELAQFDSVSLFAERARALLPRFALSHAMAPVVAAICRRLDGLPLAIELVSARVSVLAPEQILARLDDLFQLLDSTASVSGTQRTLAAALDWSYGLLPSPEQAVLRRLSVFAGGCSLATAEAVCAGEPESPALILQHLSSLVNKSLVIARTLEQGEARYALLEPVRQYASEKLGADPAEQSAARNRHLACLVALAEEIAPKLTGPYQKLWLAWLEDEHDNIRAALSYALKSDQIEPGLRIAVAAYNFWTVRDYAEEGLDWFTRLLLHAEGRIPPVLHANALAYASFLAGFRGNSAAQMSFGRAAAALAESTGESGRAVLRFALSGLAYGARAAGDFDAELAAMRRVIQINRDLGDSLQLGITLSIGSFSAMALGFYDEARAMLDESLSLLRPSGNSYRVAMALNFAGDLARLQEDYRGACAPYEESISLLRQLGAARDIASVLQNLGHARLHRGELERSRALFAEALALQSSQRNTPGVAECLLGFGALAIASGQPAAGARLLAAAVQIGGERLVTAWAATRVEYERSAARARGRLSAEEWQAEQAAGRALSLEQAVACALALVTAQAAAPPSRNGANALTARERQIAVLIARGKSNGEIAGDLVVSKRTVEKHIANILSKLGLANRAQIVRQVIESGLDTPSS